MSVNAITSRSDLAGPDRGDEFIKNFNARNRGSSPSLELRTISFFRDDLIRGTFIRQLGLEDIAEDVARIAFVSLRDCSSSDLTVIETALSQRLFDGEILADITTAFVTVTVPLSSNDLAYCMRHVGEYIKYIKVMGHLSTLQDSDFPSNDFPDPGFYSRLGTACALDFSSGSNGDRSLYRFSTTADFLRAREKSAPTGTTIPSHFGLVNEALPGG